MAQFNIFALKSIELDIHNAIQDSLFNFGAPRENLEFWAESSLRKNTEMALAKIADTNFNITTDPPPNNNGFKVMFGLQLSIGYKVRFKATANLGYGKRWNNFGTTSSLHFAAYKGGLGTAIHKSNLVVDITAAVNLTVGGGQGTPLQSYSLNYNSPIPNLNDFKNSFSYGQLLTWNSNLNKNKFSLSDIQREGMIGFRLGDFNISSNNDTKRFYFGDGGDRSWTGGISVSTPLFEIGFQDFSGDYNHNAPSEQKLKKLNEKIKDLKKNSSLSKDEKKSKIQEIDEQILYLTNNNLHTQNPSQQKLNKASTYFKINNNGYNATIDIIGDAWLQNFIHRKLKGFRFDYQHKDIELWGGKKF